jgi:hypothetical protein
MRYILMTNKILLSVVLVLSFAFADVEHQLPAIPPARVVVVDETGRDWEPP